jgi:hypothetical protein
MIKMTLNELIFDSLESLEAVHIDYGQYTKELTKELYAMLEKHEVVNWYLDIKNNKPCIIVKLDN